ncbi:hypothetical protein BJY01DRAFT_251440 [Aspergillus pseudoustus]|uniref:Uncharacterized protein n=1 Tax=Aspergillus pseudoustus TaxID=1810923 RepID=A0ABR4JBP3_9EURO
MPPDHSVFRMREGDDVDADREKLPFLSRSGVRFRKQGSGSTSLFWLNIWAFCNATITIFLLITAFYLKEYAKSLSIPDSPTPPPSPLWEDGIVRYINTRYKPSKIFQSPPSDEADAAWDGWLLENDQALAISTDRAKQLGLRESVEF